MQWQLRALSFQCKVAEKEEREREKKKRTLPSFFPERMMDIVLCYIIYHPP